VLTNWNLVDEDSTIIFISHEWVGWNHPDPYGVQLRTALRVLQRLRDGEIKSVVVDPKAEIFHHCKYNKTRKEWMRELKNAYIWFDWICMPQPMASNKEKLNDRQKKMLEKNGRNAVMSISAYVERCDFLLITAPGMFFCFFLFFHVLYPLISSLLFTLPPHHHHSLRACGSYRYKDKTEGTYMFSNVEKTRVVCVRILRSCVIERSSCSCSFGNPS